MNEVNDYGLKDGEQALGVQEFENGSVEVTYADKDGKIATKKLTKGKAEKEGLDAGESEVGVTDVAPVVEPTVDPVVEDKPKKAAVKKSTK